ncbi:putative E3 ubiquitin-protein ligase BAH1-like [Vitis vinifera]|uniref:Putative E3 ubiquitin-protein ligase BAH1-like n=1 Tax=Vitis vinifera TaxID=29760 RepID=A0A438II95_VITVI|nr:putative E3 ubiquitin-protein ligase BAH1-like [Vitis vinifera]RVW96420.1 putative E3 ubiquitin-protein ligase BAH1-like [Vitis vinifera]
MTNRIGEFSKLLNPFDNFLVSNLNQITIVKAGVYSNAVEMLELDLLLKRREYWKERLIAERAEMVKQAKDYWDSQTKYVIGY